MLKSIFNRTSKNNRQPAKRTLDMESMEERKLMTTNVFLDFDGSTQAEVNHACSTFACWRDRPSSGGMMGFQQGFSLLNGRYRDFSFLDFDGNGRLNSTDGVLASEAVLDRVSEDFAPYDVNVVSMGNSNEAIRQMRNSTTGDALIFANGGSSAVGGQAPEDHGNRRDESTKNDEENQQ